MYKVQSTMYDVQCKKYEILLTINRQPSINNNYLKP